MPSLPNARMPDFFCRVCGRGIGDGDHFCGFCGTYYLARGHRILRYDGVYATRAKRDHGGYLWEQFRFYADGWVAHVVFFSRIDGEPATWWGRRVGPDIYGSYRTKGRAIQIACMGHGGVLLYAGRVRKDGVRLTACNGRECGTFYRFYEGAEGEHKGKSLAPSPEA
jgi:hypothetical protein